MKNRFIWAPAVLLSAILLNAPANADMGSPSGYRAALPLTLEIFQVKGDFTRSKDTWDIVLEKEPKKIEISPGAVVFGSWSYEKPTEYPWKAKAVRGDIKLCQTSKETRRSVCKSEVGRGNPNVEERFFIELSDKLANANTILAKGMLGNGTWEETKALLIKSGNESLILSAENAIKTGLPWVVASEFEISFELNGKSYSLIGAMKINQPNSTNGGEYIIPASEFAEIRKRGNAILANCPSQKSELEIGWCRNIKEAKAKIENLSYFYGRISLEDKKLALADGVDFNAEDRIGNTFLMTYVMQYCDPKEDGMVWNRVDSLKNKIDFNHRNRYGNTVLALALGSSKSCKGTVEKLLSYGAGGSLMQADMPIANYAIYKNNKAVLEALIKHGIKPASTPYLFGNLGHPYWNEAEYNLGIRDSLHFLENPVVAAVQSGDLQNLQDVLNAKSYSTTPVDRSKGFLSAFNKNRFDMAKEIMSHGIDSDYFIREPNVRYFIKVVAQSTADNDLKAAFANATQKEKIRLEAMEKERASRPEKQPVKCTQVNFTEQTFKDAVKNAEAVFIGRAVANEANQFRTLTTFNVETNWKGRPEKGQYVLYYSPLPPQPAMVGGKEHLIVAGGWVLGAETCLFSEDLSRDPLLESKKETWTKWIGSNPVELKQWQQ